MKILSQSQRNARKSLARDFHYPAGNLFSVPGTHQSGLNKYSSVEAVMEGQLAGAPLGISERKTQVWSGRCRNCLLCQELSKVRAAQAINQF